MCEYTHTHTHTCTACMHACLVPLENQSSIQVVTSTDVNAGTEPGFSARAAGALNHPAVSPAPVLHILAWEQLYPYPKKAVPPLLKSVEACTSSWLEKSSSHEGRVFLKVFAASIE